MFKNFCGVAVIPGATACTDVARAADQSGCHEEGHRHSLDARNNHDYT